MGKFWPETDDLDCMEDAAIDQPAFFFIGSLYAHVYSMLFVELCVVCV